MYSILMRTVCLVPLSFTLFLLWGEPVAAQGLRTQGVGAALQQPLPNNATPMSSPVPTVPDGMPDDHMQVRLIRNALIALNHANVTGNYTVLRDLCSPGFREEQTAADFAVTFYNAHDRGRDLSFVMELKPIPIQQPVLASDGRLRLKGLFPTEPLVLTYDLVYLRTERGDWWIDGIVIGSSPVDAAMRPQLLEYVEQEASGQDSSPFGVGIVSNSSRGSSRDSSNPYRP